MKLVLTIDGVDVAVDHVNGKADAVEHPPVEAWQQIMVKSNQDNYMQQGRPDPWPALAPATIKRRLNKSNDTILILRDTGKMMQSTSAIPNEYSLSETTQFSAAIGTNRPGARNHNEGDTLPKRRFLFHQPEDIEDFKIVYIDHINGVLQVISEQ